MSGGGPCLPPGRLAVLSTFAEALALSAKHSLRLFAWSAPVTVAGLAATAATALFPDIPAVYLGAPAAFLLYFAVAFCAFCVRVHRLILWPGEPASVLPVLTFPPGTWRYARGLAVAAAVGILPATAVWLALDALTPEGMPEAEWAALSLVLAFLAAQAAMARSLFLYLTGLSLRARGSWRASTAIARGCRGRLALLGLASGAYTLGVSVFAGWMVGMVFPNGPQGLLEFLTIVVGLPAQMGCFACLQAACYRRLSPDPLS